MRLCEPNAYRVTGAGESAESCPRVPPGPPPPISDIGYPVSTVSPLSCRRVPGRDRGQRVSAASASSRDHRHSHTPTGPVSVRNPPRRGSTARSAVHTTPSPPLRGYATTSIHALRLTHRLVCSSCDLGGSPPVGFKLHCRHLKDGGILVASLLRRQARCTRIDHQPQTTRDSSALTLTVTVRGVIVRSEHYH